MKIGIFGDSFATDVKQNSTDSWIEVLGSQFDVTCYGVPGSNLFYSVSKFKEHAAKYDKNIFIVTQAGRIKISDEVPAWNEHKRHLGGINSIKFLLEEVKDKENFQLLRNAYKAAEDYYRYIRDDKFDTYVHELMLQDIMKDTNTIFIPAFGNSIPGYNGTALIDIYFKENLGWGKSGYIFQVEDTRNCHMTEENNLILGRKLINAINSNSKLTLSLDDFVTSPNKEFYIKNYE